MEEREDRGDIDIKRRRRNVELMTKVREETVKAVKKQVSPSQRKSRAQKSQKRPTKLQRNKKTHGVTLFLTVVAVRILI